MKITKKIFSIPISSYEYAFHTYYEATYRQHRAYGNTFYQAISNLLGILYLQVK